MRPPRPASHGRTYLSANTSKAINWAWNDCRADIVTMSFGFHEEIYIEDKPVISNAILETLRGTDQRILFFAAAANGGGNRQEIFPASDMHVLSPFAEPTTTVGRSTSTHRRTTAERPAS